MSSSNTTNNHNHNHSSQPISNTTTTTTPAAPNGIHSTSTVTTGRHPPHTDFFSYWPNAREGGKMDYHAIKAGLKALGTNSGGHTRRLNEDELKKHEDVIMRNLVLDYLSSACFPQTARILSESLEPTTSSSTSHSGSSSKFTSQLKSSGLIGSQGLTGPSVIPGSEGVLPGEMEIPTTATMSSSISELARIIDPSLIGSGRGTMMEGESPSSTIMSPLSSWTRPVSASTCTGVNMQGVLSSGMNNRKNRSRALEDDDRDLDVDVDVDMDHLPGRGRSSNGGVSGSVELDSRRGRDEWIRQIERRKEIRDLVAAGNIVLAMDQLKRYFPGVIGNYGVQPLSEWRKEDDDDEARHVDGLRSEKSSVEVNHETIEVDEADGESDEEDSDEEDEDLEADEDQNDMNEDEFLGEPMTMTSAVSSRPVNLYLHLVIQSFIENIRQLEPSSDQDMDLSSMASSMHSEFGQPGGDVPPVRNGKSLALEVTRMSSPEPSGRMTPRDGDNLLSSNGGGGSNKSSRTLACIAQAQRLYAEVTTYLEEDDAQPFINVLEGATALLAYPDMGSSPLAFWLSLTRRTDLAKVVNDSIIAHQVGHRLHDPSALSTLIKQTTAVTDEVKARSLDLNPGWTVAKDGQALAALADFVSAKQKFDFSEYMSER